MVTRSAPQVRRKSPDKEAPPSPENLLRALVTQFPLPTSDSAHMRDEMPGEEVVFDMVIDGSHYLLLRLPQISKPRVQLSPRELEIVRMVAQGHPNKIIADVLNISSWTVCTHLRRIFAKLGVSSRAAMVARILENGNGREPMPPRPEPPVCKPASAAASIPGRSGLAIAQRSGAS